MMKKLLLLAQLGVISLTVLAQPTLVELDSVEISSTRTIQNITRTGRNIQVITSEDIENLPVHSTDELFRYLPGVEIQSRGGFGVQSDFTLRGSTFNQVLVLVDGVRINDPLTGHFNGYIPVPLSEIERVEVIKGAASSIYGADAVGGVINVITKKKPEQGNIALVANMKAGSYGYLGTDMSVLGKANKWHYAIGLQSNKSDGQQLINPNKPIVDAATPHYNTWFNTQTYSASVGRELGEEWRVNLRASYDARDFNAKYFYTASPYDESTENTKVFFSNLKLSGTHGDFKTELDFVFRQSKDHFVFNPAFTANNHISRFGLFQLNQSFQANSDNILVYGIQVDGRSIESNDRGNHSNFHAGLFGQWVSSTINNLTSTISIRGDYDNNYQFEVSPQVNLAFILNKFVLRAGAGKGIRAADYTERFVSNNLLKLSPGRNLGNPDLIAEKSWSYELGADYYVTKEFKIVATGFYRAGSNLIDYVPTPGKDITNVSVSLAPEGTYLYSKNLTNVNTFGVEVEAWYSKKFESGNTLNLKVGYTGLESVNPKGVISKYVSAHAKHLINGNISTSISRFDFGVSGIYKMRETAYSNSLGVELAPLYFVANANLGVRFFEDKLNVNLEAINLFDIEYSDILGAQMPGRWFVIAAGVRL